MKERTKIQGEQGDGIQRAAIWHGGKHDADTGRGMGHQRDRDVVRICGRRKRKAAGLLGLAALLYAGVLFAHQGAETGDFLVVDGRGVCGVDVIGGEE